MVDDTLGSEPDAPSRAARIGGTGAYRRCGAARSRHVADDQRQRPGAGVPALSGAFPEGEFAALARDRIAALSQARQPTAAIPPDTAVELAFWDSVKDSDNPRIVRGLSAEISSRRVRPARSSKNRGIALKRYAINRFLYLFLFIPLTAHYGAQLLIPPAGFPTPPRAPEESGNRRLPTDCRQKGL